MDETREHAILRLLEVMARLRDPEHGCPWDRAQTFETIAPYTIEEAYEVADAIERGDFEALQDELGDLLLQVVYHARMAEERGLFDFYDVAGAIADKMVRRHPHVFGDETVADAEAQSGAWEKHKQREREEKGGTASVLDGIALGMPALSRALKLGKRVARVGFDWPDRNGPLDKIEEEFRELRAEVEGRRDPARLREEFGDLLFALVNLARHLRLDPEEALRHANAKFERRFRAVESKLAERGRRPQESDLAEMDALWEMVKAEERHDAK